MLVLRNECSKVEIIEDNSWIFQRYMSSNRAGGARMYQSAPDLSMGRSMSMSLGREGRPRAGCRVGSKTPKLGQADLGASTTQSELGPGHLVIARPLALGPRRSRERATVRF